MNFTRLFKTARPAPVTQLAGKKIVFMGGMYSAGTTWLHNVGVAICELNGLKVFGTYSDKVDGELLEELHRHDIVIAKSHHPTASSEAVLEMGAARLILPVRDPRDAIVSLMQRFTLDFASSFKSVSDCAANIMALEGKHQHLFLKYEDGFSNDVKTVLKLADYIGMPLAQDQAQRITDDFMPDKVRQKLKDMENKGLLDSANPRGSWDKQTNWHPGHVGDLAIRKHAKHLSAKQISMVNKATAAYIKRFGY